ncbi:MAG: alpha/beta fold hydrolase [Saprospiraceae bacterium]|nr:alpha/beta fold hydrolase [Saprospiraceae bacterium]
MAKQGKTIQFRSLVASSVFILFAFSGFSQVNFDGLWGGKITSNGLEVEVNFKVESEAKRVLLSVPLQKVNDQVGSGLEIKGDSIFFDYSNFNASYQGVYNSVTKEIRGEWTQGLSTSLNLKRIKKKSTIVRSQVVEPPFSYTYENLKFHNEEANIDLAATLTIPEGEGPFPLAVLVSGSGPQDRNSEILDHKPFLVIADHLSSNGIAVLRYDDRGVKNSGGIFSESTSADFATDAAAAINYARSLTNIDSTKIGIIGHSEGGLIAPRVAAYYNNLDFIVSIAGPAVPITELMTIQNKLIFEKSGMSEEGLDIIESRLPGIYNIVNQDKEPKELFDTLIGHVKSFYEALPENDQKLLGASSTAYYTAISRTFFSPWFRYFLAYDPGPTWQKVTCPVLALNGSEDIQVSAKENLSAIKRNLEIAGNTNHKEVELKGFNHLMQQCKVCSINEYALIETTFDPSVLELITEFIQGI